MDVRFAGQDAGVVHQVSGGEVVGPVDDHRVFREEIFRVLGDMLETVDAVRAVWPENLPLSVRLSVSDWTEGGLTIEDNIQMAKWLKERGVDFVDCSGGGATPSARASIGSRTSDQIDLGGQLRAEAGIATLVVGTITEAKQAEALIADGQADMVLLARGMMRDPYWAMHAARELGVDVKTHIPVQYGFYMG